MGPHAVQARDSQSITRTVTNSLISLSKAGRIKVIDIQEVKALSL